MVQERFEVAMPKGSTALLRALLAALPADWTEGRIWQSSLEEWAKQLISRRELDPEARALVQKRLQAFDGRVLPVDDTLTSDRLPAPAGISVASRPPAGPDADNRQVSGSRSELYHQFWSQLLDAVNSSHDNLLRSKKAPSDNWLETATGRASFVLTWSFGHGARFRCELYFDTSNKERNKRYFDLIQARQSEIEAELGPLSWERLDRKKGCRIAAVRDGAVEETDSWDELRTWAIERHIAFRRVFIPLLGTDELS